MILVLSLARAHACAMMVPAAGSLAASDAQRALFELGADAITVTYEATYAGNAADFAWVIAVPGAIETVAEGDADLLGELRAMSEPEVFVEPADQGQASGCGCMETEYDGARSMDAEAGGDNALGGVEVTATGYAGDYEYVTLRAADADALVQWLDEHGYDSTLIAPAVATYVADPLDYEFVAVQLRPDVAETGEGGVALDPLEIRYGLAADGALHASFPARMGASGTVEEVRTEWYVLAGGTAALGGWTTPGNSNVDSDGDYDIVIPDYEDPAGAYAGMLRELGQSGPVAWTTFSGAYGQGLWLTRFDAIVAPATNSVDAEFVDSGAQEQVRTSIHVMPEADYEAMVAALLPLGVGLLGWKRRRL